MITLRFCTGIGIAPMLIRAQERTTYPFVPSHVEAVDPDSGMWIGAHADGGVMERFPNYDRASLLSYGSPPKPTQLFINIPTTDAQTRIFYTFLRSKIGAPYDWGAIFDFAFPTAELHQNDHLICSALQSLALASALGLVFACPAHQTSPRDLLLVCSGLVHIPELTQVIQ